MWHLIRTVLDVKKEMEESHVGAYAAQSAYFIMLSFLPLILLLLTMIQFTGIGKSNLYHLIQDGIPLGFQSWLLGILDEMYSRTAATVSISALVTVWSAGKSFMALNRGMNVICRVEKRQNYFLMRLRGAVFAAADCIWYIHSRAFCGLFSLSGHLYPDPSFFSYGGHAGPVHVLFCAAVYDSAQPKGRFCGTASRRAFYSRGLVSVFLWIFHLY